MESPEAKPKLVLINDETTALKTLARILGKDYQVQCYLNPIEAWQALEAGEPADLILADLYMPGLDGISLVRYMKCSSRSDLRHLPVIISSTVAGGDDIEELAVQAGALGFVALPLRPSELRERVRDILRGDFSGSKTDVAFYTSKAAVPLVVNLCSLFSEDNFRTQAFIEGINDKEEVKDLELIIFTDDLVNIEETLAELSVPGRVSVLFVFSLTESFERVHQLMKFGADAVFNSAVSEAEFLKAVQLCQRQRAWYRIMERRYLGQEYSVEH